jgi:hypothetical protein
LIKDLYECFQINGELMIFYGYQETWGWGAFCDNFPSCSGVRCWECCAWCGWYGMLEKKSPPLISRIMVIEYGDWNRSLIHICFHLEFWFPLLW